MNYLEWNKALGDHFFPEGAGSRQVFLCVTLDILSELCGLDPQAAVDDFVAAIKCGPPWTDARCCRRICNKAMHCLFPSTLNKKRGTEDRDLSKSVGWRRFEGARDGDPPYLAYLGCFVLAWTERSDNDHGSNYYTPLNNLLSLEGRDAIGTNDFGKRYGTNDLRKGEQLSTKTLWRDLEEWSMEVGRDRGVLYLPSCLKGSDFVEYPKCYGLLKAQDLRALDGVFAVAEEHKELKESKPLDPLKMCEVVERYAGNKLSNACLTIISRGAGEEREAAGRLLADKYRAFDGVVEGNDDLTSAPRCTRMASILRTLCVDRGGIVMRHLCRFSGNTWTKLPLSPDDEYEFIAERGGVRSKLKWVEGTPWCEQVEWAIGWRDADLEFTCPAIMPSFRAVLQQKNMILMASGEMYHWRFGGVFVEVPNEDTMKLGQEYRLLVRGDLPGQLRDSAHKQHVDALPSGWTLWSLCLNETVDLAGLGLPPLENAQQENVVVPAVAGVRVSPREDKYFLQFPPVIRLGSGGHDNILSVKKTTGEDVQKVMTAEGVMPCLSEPCAVVAAGAQQFNYKEFELRNLDDADQQPSVPVTGEDERLAYPYCALEITGDGALYAKAPSSYISSSPPNVECKGVFDIEKIQVDGQVSNESALKEPGSHTISIMMGDTVLEQEKVHVVSSVGLQFRIVGLTNNTINDVAHDAVAVAVECYAGETPIVGLRCPYSITETAAGTERDSGTLRSIMPQSERTNVAWRKTAVVGRVYRMQLKWNGQVVSEAQFRFPASPNAQPPHPPCRRPNATVDIAGRAQARAQSGFAATPFDQLDVKGKRKR